MIEPVLKEWIDHLAKGPEGQIDEAFKKRCREFNGGDPVRFLRDLRDDLVFYSGCSDVVIEMITALLSSHPEDPEAMAARHAALERKRKEVAGG